MSALPSGTVTFLFTDLEGSTRLWEEHPDAMKDALGRHDEILREAVAGCGGLVVKKTGDGVHAAFGTAPGAIAAAIRAQQALASEDWHEIGGLRVRMGLHTGVAELQDGDYYGTAVNKAARLMSVAHGGQVVVSLATEELVRDVVGDGVELLDLGEHRLRDLSRPERVFQLVVSGLPRKFPPLRSLDVFAGNLPGQLTSFVGRHVEVALVTETLAAARLVTITGLGGVGKTRLALQVAAGVVSRFAEGAWLCELAAAADAETMLQVVGSALGVMPRPEMSLEASLVDFLRPRSVLLVLDNCEHLLGPVAGLAESVGRECLEVHVLATSREALSVPGEHVVELRSLPVPRRGDTAEQISGSEAVELFGERARAARSGFTVEATNAEAVAEICRRLDGIPLALELAASRVGAMSPAEIASHLDERFRLLRGVRHAALERHQTLRATVDWSYSLLDRAERMVFYRLGVFAGPFDAHDARAVVSGAGIEEWDVLDAIAGLVAKSMLVADEDDDGVTRYQMLETMRAYARERLDENAESDTWRRHLAEHYSAFAIAARDGLLGAEELVWRRRLRAELDNVRAAVFWSLDSDAPGDHHFALAIAANLATEVQGDRASGIGSWAARALPVIDEATAGQRAALLGAAALDAFNRGDLDATRELAAQAVRTAVPVDCPCPALPFVGRAAARPDADTIVSEALEHSDAIRQHPWSEALLLGVRGIFRSFGGNSNGARLDAAESLARARRIANPLVLVVALTATGYAWIDDDTTRAREAFEESVALTRAGASDVNFSIALRQLARLRMQDGDSGGALDALHAAVTHDHACGNRPSLVGALAIGCESLATLGHLDDALVLACAVIEGELSALTGLGGVAVSLQALLVKTRAVLDTTTYEAAVAHGEALSYEEVVAYALNAIDTARAELQTDDA
jgi:predicted ATPase/class 3 adenylate cyclase